MKNKILKIALAFMFAFCSISMFACGGEAEAKMPYKDFETFVSEMEANTTLFQTTTLDGVSTKYVIKPLNTTENTYFNECLITPITYIAKYHTALSVVAEKENLTGEQNEAISKFEISAAKMKIAYEQLNSRLEILNTFASQDKNIYDGVLQVFKPDVTTFIASTYETAINLSNIQEKVVESVNAMLDRKLEVKDTERLRDYTALKLGQDYFNLLLVNTNSKSFTVSSDQNEITYKAFLDQIKIEQTNFIKNYLAVSSLKDITSAPEEEEGKEPVYLNTVVQDVLNSEKLIENERKMLNKALENFSFSDFFKLYTCSIDKYEKDKEKANEYLAEITLYYGTYTKQHIDYLKTLLIR